MHIAVPERSGHDDLAMSLSLAPAVSRHSVTGYAIVGIIAPERATSIRVVSFWVGSDPSLRAGVCSRVCLEIDLSAVPGSSPDTYRSGGVTF